MICRAFVVVLPKMEINREVRNKKLCGYIWRHCFESPVALHDANEKRVQCAVFDL